jgi:3-hydroxymyristoyl/3-hydroxydecanoyl-(acyl carrier protein) dehydratase/malonyl CoA-acyl carrier protein transacylase
VRPSAVIGYSLGETVGYFATGAWPDRGQMLARMEQSELFRTQLAGPCRAARGYLPLPEEVPVEWRAAVVNRPAAVVRKSLKDAPAVRLLMINTPEECVIGGHGPAVADLIDRMNCEAVYLEGIVAVHWEAVQTVAEAYRTLHLFPTTPPDGIAYYSCAAGGRIDLTPETAADSLLKQAIEGFDFPATIEQAYRDGTRLFLEVGPRGSCTRMIHRILSDRPHLALTVSPDPENEVTGMAKALGVLSAERLPIRLDRFFPPDEALSPSRVASSLQEAPSVSIDCSGRPLDPPQPPQRAHHIGQAASPQPTTIGQDHSPPVIGPSRLPSDENGTPSQLFFDQTSALIRGMNDHLAATGDTHKRFLALAEDLGRQYAQTVNLHTRLADQAQREGIFADWSPEPSLFSMPRDEAAPPLSSEQVGSKPAVAFDRTMCMEFAVGSVAKVLGPEFAAVDQFPARVRLPDEPLMLVDRILSVEGHKGVLGPGRLVTEHDVRPDAWYLDGERAPVCIAVEAGQADLFLSAYLGIDLEVKGERTYRLLDATVTFHRGLPRPGEVIRYDIRIEKFIRQGPTWLFFFQFDGTIDGQPLITMRNGCAGFFTEAEVRRSGGIILTEEDTRPLPGVAPDEWQSPVPMAREAYDAAALEALRQGDLEGCFGPSFEGLRLPENQRLPGGRMALIHRVLMLDPADGRYGLGTIRAEADIHPDDWFLTCHFVDDMVMPGTLMYECCAHTLRIYLQRMGWISDRADVVFEPVVGRQAVLKCRGPVTPETRRVVYEVEVSEIGFNPEPYVIADAHMYADGHRIVLFRGMTMKMTGMNRAALEHFWRRPIPSETRQEKNKVPDKPSAILFSRERLIEFATGLPSKAFGPPYEPFDRKRFIARLPGPPYAFIDAVTRIEPPPWVVTPDGWVETVYQPNPEDWYFRSTNAAFMPVCILMEIALQACGFLAAYMGSALQSEKDLHFRNLDGEATLQANAFSDDGPVRTRARLLQFSAAGDMLIQHYAFEVRQANKRVYEGQTSFGFFTPEALANQVGLPEADRPPAPAKPGGAVQRLENIVPLTPADPRSRPQGAAALPSRALRMIDCIEDFDPQGGPHGLGYVCGSKAVDPEEWFFKAHFFQDPVCPGSLGIESLIQLLQYAAGALWPEEIQTLAMALMAPATHTWRYRGQILPTHQRVTVEAFFTECHKKPYPLIKADGYLKCDGLYIYKMKNFGLGLMPRGTLR